MSGDPCPACGGGDCVRIAEYRARHVAFGPKDLMCCRRCDLTFASPMPTAEALDQYNRHYWSEAHGGMEETPSAWATDAGLNALRAQYVVRQLQAGWRGPIRVLEIGPGRGFFMSRLRPLCAIQGYDAVESDETCHPQLAALGARVFPDLGEVPHGPAYDLIVASHVLEHLSEPATFLAALASRLGPEGALFIETPCQDHRFKTWHEPHLLFFDKTAMRALLARVGCRTLAMGYFGKPVAVLAAEGHHRGSILRRVRARLVTEWHERRLSGRNVGSLTLAQLRPFVVPLQADTEQSVPSWWLRTIAGREP